MHLSALPSVLPTFLTAGLLVSSAAAQWPGTPSPNLSVADLPGEQVLPKIAATHDGGCYIGWFDQSSGSYQLRLQKLDARGVELWPRQGRLISANPQSSSLVDWDLLCDRYDHCVLAFTDTRAGSDLDVYAYRVDPSGAMVWGANGVTLSSNSDYEPSPKLCETSPGEFACVWANLGTRDLRVQRINRIGQLLHPANGLIVPGDPGATPAFCRVVAGHNGDVILSWVSDLAFNGQKHVHAQKIDIAGRALWGRGSRLPIFDLASVPIAHEPRLLADGSGGAIFAWHFAVGQSFSVRVQRVLRFGNEAFSHNGIEVCTNANSKLDPTLAWHAPSESLYVAWNERNLAQSQWGISLQKLDATGALRFGPNGLVLLPVNGVVKYAPVCAPLGEGVVCSVLEESLGGRNDTLRSLRVNSVGQLVWPAPVDVSLFPSDKLRLSNAVTTSGVVLNVWTDLRQDNGDVVAQNLNPDGTLGDATATSTPYGCGGNPAGSLAAGGRAAIGTLLQLHVDNPLGTQTPGSLALLILGTQPDRSPCGTPIPGYGMRGQCAIGESLIDFAAPNALLTRGPWLGVGAPVTFFLPVPFLDGLAGSTVYAQGLMIDLGPQESVAFGLTNALRIEVGY
jgi:hypothetical protein